MTSHLTWELFPTYIEFKCHDGSGDPIRLDEWARSNAILPSGTNANVAPILAALNSADVRLDGDSVQLSHEYLASLSGREVLELGLPRPAPIRLNIRSEGAMATQDFTLRHSLKDDRGRPLIGFQHTGMIGEHGTRRYSLLDPLYSALIALEKLESEQTNDIDRRFSLWAEVARHLPPDAQLDDQLTNLNIVQADFFSLHLHSECDFDPVIVRAEIDELSEEESNFQAALPEHFQSQFAHQFRELSSAKEHYALGDGWYVLVPDKVRQGLSEVHRLQSAPLAERRAFVSNPSKLIDGGTDNGQDEAPIFIETLDFLSERIVELGQWSPKLATFVSTSGAEWLPPEDIRLVVVVGDTSIEVPFDQIDNFLGEIEQAASSGQSTVQLDGQTIPVTEEVIEEFRRLSSAAAAQKPPKDTPDDEPRKPTHVPILIDNIEDLGYVAKTRPPSDLPLTLPRTLKTTSLFEFQSDGIRWLQEHWNSGNSGALLADDMGLGKTIQTLTFCAWVREAVDKGEISKKPILIVAPTGLLKNWQDEAVKHLHPPGLGDLLTVYGQGKRALKHLDTSQRHQRMSRADWVLTTYETLRDEILWFINVDWQIVAFDEAQRIKNPAARVTEMAKSLKSDFMLPLTGTPVENSLFDLWCIMDTAQPGLLGSQRQFDKNYVQPSQNDPQHPAQLKSLLQDETTPASMLRRMKEEHLHGLPEKTHHVSRVDMNPVQQTAYNEVVDLARHKGISRNTILEIIQKLRSVSLLGVDIPSDGIDESVLDASARLRWSLNVLDQIHEQREKALIFLESLEFQKELVPFLQRRYGLPKPPARISGEVPGMRRKQIVDDFQALPENEFAVMILSPKAGGVGLTLTAANHVIHLSRWWNPAVEDQCTDRVYRIGQSRPVHIWCPLAVHPGLGDKSFDVNLDSLLHRKRELSKTALLAQFSKDDAINLAQSSM
jgi:hypothetical protein